MTTGIDPKLRKKLLSRLQATNRFWELSKYPYMFRNDPDNIYFQELVQGKSEEEKFEGLVHKEILPEPKNEFGYVNCFKPHSVFMDKMYGVIKTSETKIACLPVNRYTTGTRIDGPFIHDSNIINTFSPRSYSGWLLEKLNNIDNNKEYLNSGQAFFHSLDLSWVVYTTGSLDPDSVVYLLADQKFTDFFFSKWPEIINYIHRRKS